MAAELTSGVRGEQGLEVLLLPNIAVMDTQQDAAGLQDAPCLSKMVHNALASSPAPQLLSYLLLQLFSLSYFILGLRGTSGYLPNIC